MNLPFLISSVNPCMIKTAEVFFGIFGSEVDSDTVSFSPSLASKSGFVTDEKGLTELEPKLDFPKPEELPVLSTDSPKFPKPELGFSTSSLTESKPLGFALNLKPPVFEVPEPKIEPPISV